ncbi:MAG TPA: hypothetical protein PLP19_12860 [bacterium]|nr:hypothetical protein [bacterium]HPN44376.1 hypothetical protein [bacterium]
MFDWVTWSIWLLGFIILVVWIVVPFREYKQLVKERQQEGKHKQKQANA